MYVANQGRELEKVTKKNHRIVWMMHHGAVTDATALRKIIHVWLAGVNKVGI